VSLDEESVNLVSAQHAYQAAARVLTAIDQALDTLINRTGTVGL
jgi:flagellar hook-associated protein 1